jgi:signal peptidase II
VSFGPQLRLALLTGGLVLVADQLTKAIVTATMSPEHAVTLGSFVSLVHVRNTGAAFSLLAGMPPAVRLPLFLAVTVLAAGALLNFLRRTRPDQRWVVGAIGAILGGALGNLVCRVRLGAVIDFVDLHWGDLHWPAFNVADAAITIGVVVVMGAALRER